MVIQKIYIKGFGGLKEREFLLSDGLNIIYGENESGKSTIAEFIRAILYGIDSGVRNIRENERLHYMPLDGSVMGGSLEVEHDGRMYLISRTFGKTKSKDKLSVTDAVTGAELDLTPEDLIGIDNSSFMKTLYIRQLSTKVEGSKNDEILKKLINLSQTGEEEASYQNARTLLNNALKGLNSKAKGIIPRINQEIADLQTERAESIRAEEKLARIEQEIIEYKKQQDLLHKKLQEKSKETKYTQQYEKWSNIKEQAELKEKLEKEKQDNTRLQLETKIDALSGKKNIYLVLFIISLMLFTCGYFITPLLVFSAVSAVFLIYYLKTNKKINAIREEIKEIGKDTCNKPCDDVKYKQWFMDELGSDDFEKIPDLIENYSKLFKERQLSYNQQIVELAEKIRDKENEKNNMPNRAVAAIDQDITMKSNQLNAYIQKESAIKNAIEALDYAFDQLQQNFAPKLNRHTSRVLSEITEGKYKEVRADNVYNLTLIDSKGEAISADYLSTGCYDQIYFALRMGMIELLDIDAPIILDDAFAFYDENRLQRAMDYIKKLQRQLILFTCQRREKGGNMFNL